MNNTNKQKWREDFELGNFGYKLNFDKGADGFYLHPSVELQWNGYYVARKKAHSENEDAFKAFTLDLADRYEKEIELLKAELKDEREAVDFYASIEGVWESDNTYDPDRVVLSKDSEWLKDHGVVSGKLARSTVKNRRIVL